MFAFLILMIIICIVLLVLLIYFIFINLSIKKQLSIFDNLINGNLDYKLKKENRSLTKIENQYLQIHNNFISIISNLYHFNKKLKLFISELTEKLDKFNNGINNQIDTSKNFDSAISILGSSLEFVSNNLNDSRNIFSEIINNFELLFEKIDEIHNKNYEIQNQINFFNKTTKDAIYFTSNLKKSTMISIEKIDHIISFINELNNSVKQIFKMTDLIGDITSKTNLLAMNASIEAAHAGEAGRGFSVVSEEIRKLSFSSDKATKSINELIKTIADKINIGNELSNNAKTGINQLENDIENAIDLLDNLSKLSQEQIVTIENNEEYINDLFELSKKIKESSDFQAKKITEIYENTDTVNAQSFIISTLLESQKNEISNFKSLSKDLIAFISTSNINTDHYEKILTKFKFKKDALENDLNSNNK